MIRKQSLSFKHALEGLKWVLKTQPNFKIHIFLSILSILGGWYFKISYVEFLIILTLIFIGLVIDFVNEVVSGNSIFRFNVFGNLKQRILNNFKVLNCFK